MSPLDLLFCTQSTLHKRFVVAVCIPVVIVVVVVFAKEIYLTVASSMSTACLIALLLAIGHQ